MLSARSEAIGIGPEHRLTLANVIEIATGTDAGHSQGPPKHPDLLAAIRTVATPRRAQQPDAKTPGRWMQRRKGRVIDGVRFAAVSNPKGGSKWWIEDPHDHHQHDLFLRKNRGLSGTKGVVFDHAREVARIAN